MNKIEKHVDKIIKYNVFIKKEEKNDFRMELIQHLYDIKEEYLNNGLSDKEATDLAIKEFNRKDFSISKIIDIKEEKATFKFINFLNHNIILLISYLSIFIISNLIIENSINNNYFYFFNIFFILFISFNISLRNFRENKMTIKYFCFLSCSFFLIEKVVIFFSLCLFSSQIKDDLNISNMYMYNKTNIISYFLIVLFFILLFKILNQREQKLFVFKFNYIDIYIILLGIILNLLYMVFPNRFYLLNRIISKIINTPINFFDKNLFYININNSIKIYNIGLFIIIIFSIYKLSNLILKRKFMSN